MVVHRENIHLYIFGPKTGRVEQAFGVTVRFRSEHPGVPVWRHFRVRVAWAGKRRGWGAYKFEADTWRTSPQTYRWRVGIKSFVRFKVGLGGRVA